MALHKIIKIVGLLLSVAGIILLAMIVSNGDEVVQSTGEGLDPFMYVAYITMGIAVVITVLFALKGIFAGDIKKTLISLGVLIAVVVISYILADGVQSTTRDGAIITASTDKWIGTGLYVFYILAVVAVGAMVFSGIKKLAK